MGRLTCVRWSAKLILGLYSSGVGHLVCIGPQHPSQRVTLVCTYAQACCLHLFTALLLWRTRTTPSLLQHSGSIMKGAVLCCC